MGANAEDELNAIISQLDKLQEEIGSDAEPQKQKTALKVVSSTAVPFEGDGEEVAETSEETPESNDETQILENELREFQSGAGEASLEDTLSTLEQTEPAQDSLLAQVSEIDAPEQHEEETEEERTATVQEIVEEVAEAFQEHSETPPVHNFDEVLQEETMANKDSTQPGSVTMTLTGNMTLNLRYEFEGQEVCVGFEDQCLKVQLTDGTEFKIPMGKKGSTLKRVV